MTEKRFIIDKYCNWVDTITGKWMTEEYVLEVMNKLAGENEQLKRENKQLKEDNKSWQRTSYRIDKIAHEDRDYAERMYKENEQLKQQLKKENELKEAIDRIDSLIHTQEDYLAWSIIYETLTDGKPLDYRLKM